ncbi:hypothetical protein DICPUDRAFT_154453 [Dictyostelium purpureum]|uniref:CHCH domain-containing protein n=1 Tax=Dictyostelium purpureum TaxID=5786 RepID=F0ZRD0_DICPU|nr:uncharacterized protein DICPUDRAFT_154453 [Dictyostelium purpureum]EGC33505.1 hypothetical protein DICPUDRAFT_154453 [Dictyostelium purpureum]|eukprot:XP_003289979.1 hypothetical protein DICPUDRAFT_154453 [Dictyostelium purpureum]
MGFDRDDNPYKLSPRFKHKVPVVRNETVGCIPLFTDLGACLSQNDFDASKCSKQLKSVEDCKRETRIQRRISPFNFHFHNVIKNKYRIPIGRF